MPRNVTIVMYHFVRDLPQSKYPEIKGLLVDEFKEQLAYIQRYYTPIKMQDLVDAVSDDSIALPPNALLLTFDDGYSDHFANVFPLLDQAGISGAFFPPGKAICEGQVLDVNKIHFVLASVPDKQKIIEVVFSEIETNIEMYSLQSPDRYYRALAIPNRYDSAEVIFIKRILQRELPETLRSQIIDNLFQNFVTRDEKAFAAELYMSIDQLKCMQRNGMYIGSHGYDHYWLNAVPRDVQINEIERSLNFLMSLGCSRNNWVMCYPYGGYNDSLIEVLKEAGCTLGLSTHIDIADLDNTNRYVLPRIDTNDLPKPGNFKPNIWTKKASI